MRAKSPVPMTTTGFSFRICVRGVYRQRNARRPAFEETWISPTGLACAGNTNQSDSKLRSVEKPLQNEKRPQRPAVEDQTEGDGEDRFKGDLANSARESLH